jgi:hypothetical protein
MTDWEKFLERRKANIGFITRGKAFRESTEYEKAEALARETKVWQESIGKRPFHIGMEYSISRGYEYDIEPLNFIKRDNAIKAYVETPMDKNGVFLSQGIDVEKYKWKEVGIFRAFFNWIMGHKVRRKND